MERSMTRLWEERHDKVVERSMTRLWQEVWPDHGKQHGHIMEKSLVNPNKVMNRTSKKYIKARTQAESLGWIEPRFRTCS